MLIKFDFKLRFCVYFLILFNLLEQLNCRKTSQFSSTNEQNKNDAIENANLLINNDETRLLDKKLSNPKAKYSLNKYFLIYNLLNSKRSKRSPLNPSNKLSINSLNTVDLRKNFKENFKSPLFKRQTSDSFANQFRSNLVEEAAGVHQLNTSLSFLNLLDSLKKQQPSCTQLKDLWQTSLSRLVDFFLNENNDLFTQSHINQMDNPIFLAMLINLIEDQNQQKLKLLNFNQLKDKNHLFNRNHDLFYNKFLNGKHLNYERLAGLRNGKAHYFGEFGDKNQDSKFIQQPMDRLDRHDHGLEIIEDGPTFVYNIDSDSNKPSDFWSDAQLSKPVNKPEIRYT